MPWDGANPVTIVEIDPSVVIPTTPAPGSNPEIGTWGYQSGGGSGVANVTLSGSKRVTGLSIRADSAVTFQLDGGDVVSLKKNQLFILNPKGNLVDPVIDFLTGSWNYFVEFVT